MKVLNDVMMVGSDAKRTMRLITREAIVLKCQTTVNEGEDSMQKMIETENNDRLRHMTAARWHWDEDTDAEAQMAELVDTRRHGAYLAHRIHLDEVQRLDLNNTLDATSRRLAEIRSQQELREAMQLDIVRRDPAPGEEHVTPEIVHPPIIGDQAEYNAEQDSVEAVMAQQYPTMYRALFGGHHAADIMVSELTADHERGRASSPNTNNFDDHVAETAQRIARVICEHTAQLAADRPVRRDSERP